MPRRAAISSGSSPLARGAHQTLLYRGSLLRLIPARTGNTRKPTPPIPCVPAHPRSRGEHSSMRQLNQALAGSSPLARGPHDGRGHPHHQGGLIPARAGTTDKYRIRNHREWAHPRSRGDHPGDTGVCCTTRGSSPLARGPPFEDVQHRKPRGLIPARAGTTNRLKRELGNDWAHPRSRGDHRRVET